MICIQPSTLSERQPQKNMPDLNKANNEQLIAWTKRIMILAGFWNLPLTNNCLLKRAFRAYSFFMRFGCFSFWFLLFLELIRLVACQYETAVIIASLSVEVNAIKIVTKMVIYLRCRILELFEEVIEFERETWQSGCEEIKTLYKRNVRVCKWYVMALGSITLMAVIALESSGLMELFHIIEYNKVHNVTLEPHLMYQSILPLNKVDHLHSMFAIQLYLSWVGLTYNTTTQIVFLTLMVYAASRLQVLQIRLRNSIGLDFSADQSENQIALLKGFIREHNYILGFVQRFNDFTKYIIMIEFILTSVDTASVATNLIKIRMSEIGWLLFFLILLLVQISLIGWTCNEIKIQSEGIADAIYQSKWYLLNKEAKQLAQIMMVRAQRPLLMTIGPFGPMTTSSVLTVFKAAYSYVSIMRK